MKGTDLAMFPRPNGIFPVLEVSGGALRNFGLAREQLRRKLFRFYPDPVQIFRVNESFVLARRDDARLSPNRTAR
jgi:hypothetical protein